MAMQRPTFPPRSIRRAAEPKPSSIQNVSARFFIRRLASGKLLLVKNGPINVRLPRRSNLKAFLSDDDGRTWGKGLLIDDQLVELPIVIEAIGDGRRLADGFAASSGGGWWRY